jgi:hypothetical protein
MLAILSVLFMCVVLVSCGEEGQLVQQPPPTVVPTQPQLTNPPTQAVATPTEPVRGGPNPTYGPIAIGAPISNFVGKYGLPSVNKETDVEFNIAGYRVSILPDFQDGNAYKDRALTIAAYAPKGTLWSSQQASTICTQFVPEDAKLRKTIPQVDNGGDTTGIDYLYFSTSLVSRFKPEQFVDQQQNPTTPGLFNVMYWFDTNGINECFVEPGSDVAYG